MNIEQNAVEGVSQSEALLIAARVPWFIACGDGSPPVKPVSSRQSEKN
jgi:hypothetical protein